MMEQGRSLRAVQFASEALSIYEKQNDLDGIARAHSVLGDVNRDAKGKDANGGNFPHYSEAKVHYSKAADLYKQLNKPKWQAFNLYALSSVNSLEGNGEQACKNLSEAKTVYSRAVDRDSMTESFEKGGAFSYNSFPSLEKAFKCKVKLGH